MEGNEDKTINKKRLRRNVIIAVIAVLVIVQAINMFIKYRADKAHDLEMAKARDEITILQHELEERLIEIDSLGGNVEDLELIVAELEEEKANLLDRTMYSERQLVRLRERVDGYQELLIIKDKEIEELITKPGVIDPDKLRMVLDKQERKKELLDKLKKLGKKV